MSTASADPAGTGEPALKAARVASGTRRSLSVGSATNGSDSWLSSMLRASSLRTGGGIVRKGGGRGGGGGYRLLLYLSVSLLSLLRVLFAVVGALIVRALLDRSYLC